MILLLSAQLLTPPLPTPLPPLHGPWQERAEQVERVPRFTMEAGTRLHRATNISGPWEYVGCVVSNEHGLKVEWVETQEQPVRFYKIERP